MEPVTETNMIPNNTMTAENDFQPLLSTVLMYIILVIVVAGLAGNGLIFLVFFSKTITKQPSNVFIMFLAASDSTFLVVVFLDRFLKNLRYVHFPDAPLDLRHQNNFFCKFLLTFNYTLPSFSSMLILFFTIERVIAVYFPLKVKLLCTTKRSVIICVLIFLIIICANAPVLVLLSIEGERCVTLPKWHTAYYVSYIINKVMFLILPVFAIALMNFCIICKVLTSSRVATRRDGERRDQNRQVTIILILISVSYIILYFPFLIVYLLAKTNSQFMSLPKQKQRIVKECTETLYISVFAINFCLYSIGSQLFRDRLKQLFCRKSRNNNTNTRICRLTTRISTSHQESSCEL